MPRGGGRGSRGKGGPPSKRGAYSGPAGGAPRMHDIPDGLPVDLSRHKDVEWVEINGSVLEGVSAHDGTMLPESIHVDNT